MEEKDTFVESVESLIETIKKLIVKPVKRITGFAAMGVFTCSFANFSPHISLYWSGEVNARVGIVIGYRSYRFCFRHIRTSIFSSSIK